jgi:hypothetical protein
MTNEQKQLAIEAEKQRTILSAVQTQISVVKELVSKLQEKVKNVAADKSASLHELIATLEKNLRVTDLAIEDPVRTVREA